MSTKTDNVFEWQRQIEEQGIQAANWLMHIVSDFSLKKRRVLVHHIQSEVAACAFHHDPEICASHVRDGLTYDLWPYIQQRPTQSHHTMQMIKDFSIWTAVQAPILSATLKKIFLDLLPEDQPKKELKTASLNICRNGISMEA